MLHQFNCGHIIPVIIPIKAHCNTHHTGITTGIALLLTLNENNTMNMATTKKLTAQLTNPLNFDFIMKTMVGIMENQLKYESSVNFTNQDKVNNFLISNFKIRNHETFACMFLDNKHQLIKYVELFNGTVDQAKVYPRIVAQKALELNAAAVIFAHNHPSGDLTPSESDIMITHKLTTVLELIDVRVLDHFIVGHSKTFSMATNGMM